MQEKISVAGYVICAGLFHIISTPFMYYELSFSPLVYICIAYSVVIIAAYIILKIKEEKTLFERVRLPEKNAIQKDKVWLGLSIVFIIAFQIFYVVYYQHTDIDDSYYLAQINTIIHTNKISAIDPASGIAELNFNPQYKMVSYEVLYEFYCKTIPCKYGVFYAYDFTCFDSSSLYSYISDWQIYQSEICISFCALIQCI